MRRGREEGQGRELHTLSGRAKSKNFGASESPSMASSMVEYPYTYSASLHNAHSYIRKL